MAELPLRIELDIFLVYARFCRTWQEEISDFYADGRPRFMWERLRQEYYLGKNDDLERICTGCPLNLMQRSEGCVAEVEGWEAFKAYIATIRPDSILLTLAFQGAMINREELETLALEAEAVESALARSSWPVAQVYHQGRPALYPGSWSLIMYPWQGEEGEPFVAGNRSYLVGRGKDGIVVRKALGEPWSVSFSRLVRQAGQVSGITASGAQIAFHPLSGLLPTWDPIDPDREGELLALDLSAEQVFGPVVRLLRVFVSTALDHDTRLILSTS